MDRIPKEHATRSRWLSEATDTRLGLGRQTDSLSQPAAKTQPCWQCDALASIQFPVGNVQAHLCLACAEQLRQVLTVALHGMDPLFQTDDEEDETRWGNA